MRTVNGVTYFDCSSFTFYALWLGGGFDFTKFGYPADLSLYQTGKANAWIVNQNMYNILEQSGWVQLNPMSVTWQQGDILIRRGEHTEFAYSNSPLMSMGARGRFNSDGSPRPLDEQVAIHTTSNNGYWNMLYRYSGQPEPPSPPPVPPIPPHPVQEDKMPLFMMLKPYWRYFT